MIPLSEAAYAVMNQPGVVPQLPPGFQMTGLIQADETLRQAILSQPNESNVAMAMLLRQTAAAHASIATFTQANTLVEDNSALLVGADGGSFSQSTFEAG